MTNTQQIPGVRDALMEVVACFGHLSDDTLLRIASREYCAGFVMPELARALFNARSALVAGAHHAG